MANNRNLERCAEWRSADIHQEPGAQRAITSGQNKGVSCFGYLTQYEFAEGGGVFITPECVVHARASALAN